MEFGELSTILGLGKSWRSGILQKFNRWCYFLNLDSRLGCLLLLYFIFAGYLIKLVLANYLLNFLLMLG